MKTEEIEGKTIRAATIMMKPDFDDRAWLRLRFTDGTECFVIACYGGYTGGSEDEYPAFVVLAPKIDDELVEAKP
jgi:hypothetical protein